jgi:hypothetical protein
MINAIDFPTRAQGKGKGCGMTNSVEFYVLRVADAEPDIS